MFGRRRRVRYLTADEVIYIREYVVHRFFRHAGDRLPGRPANVGLLESALGAPAQTFGGVDLFPAIHDKAACLFRSLAKNHAFTDGNKRTAVVATSMFLIFNFRLLLATPDEMYDLAQHVVTSHDNDKIIAEL